MLLGCAGLAVGALWMVRSQRQATRGAVTREVIARIARYAEAHGGEWPRTWKDLDVSPAAERYVRVRFDLPAARLRAEPDLIYTAVTAREASASTDPALREELDRLRARLKTARRAAGRRPGPGGR